MNLNRAHLRSQSPERFIKKIKPENFSKEQIEKYEMIIFDYTQKFLEIIDRLKGDKSLAKRFIKEGHNVIIEIQKNEQLPANIKDYITIQFWSALKEFNVLRERSKNSNLDDTEQSFSDDDAMTTIHQLKQIVEKTVMFDFREGHREHYKFIPISDLPLAEIFPEGLGFADGFCGYKGGVARKALKGIFYLDQKKYRDFDRILYETEVVNDYDVVADFNVDKKQIRAIMHTDPEGVDFIHIKNEADIKDQIEQYMASRDVNMNQVLLTKDGLYYTEKAWQSCLTGNIRSTYRLSGALFGSDIFYHNNKDYISARGLQRLVKFIVEGKAKYFEIPRYNLDVKIGVYWLVLIRKILRKGENAFYMLDRLFYCAKQMKETDSSDFNSFYKELIGVYPDFDFHDLGSEGAIKWILGRYVKAVRKDVRSRFSIKSHDIPINEEAGLVKIEINDSKFEASNLDKGLLRNALDQIQEDKKEDIA
jgi:hypothetical protein